jgi:hypothetical protein
VYQPEEVHITWPIQRRRFMLKDRKPCELLLSILVAFSAQPGLALSLDPQLLSMVPPNARVVAGVRPLNRPGGEQALLFINPENEIDLNEFLADQIRCSGATLTSLAT